MSTYILQYGQKSSELHIPSFAEQIHDLRVTSYNVDTDIIWTLIGAPDEGSVKSEDRIH